MRILILPSWYFPPGSAEISGRMFHHLASDLRDHEIDARIFYADFSISKSFLKKKSFQIEDHVPTFRIAQWYPPRITPFFIKRWIRKYADEILTYIEEEGRPDVIHAQSYMAGMVCAYLKKESGIPFILTERLSAFSNDTIPDRFFPFIKNAFDDASLITAVSPGLASAMKKFTTRSIQIIPNYFDPSIFYVDPSISKQDNFTWVSIGEPAHIKGLDILIKAFTQLNSTYPEMNSRLVIIDRIHEKEKLIKTILNENVVNRITWTGLLSQQAIGDILRRSHVLISASRTETFGKAILEAQACGVPVIATQTAGASFILTSGVQGKLIELDNVQALMHCMALVYSQYHLFKADEIAESVKNKFSKEVIIEQWKGLYCNIGK